MNALSLWILLSGFFLTGLAQGRIRTQLGNLKKVSQVGNVIVLTTPEAQMRLTAYSPEIIRVRVFRGNPSTDFSYSVILKPNGRLIKSSENVQEIVYTTGKIYLIVNKMPLWLRFSDSSGRVISEDDPSLGICWMGNSVTFGWNDAESVVQ
jgi:alpha-glucosidase